MKRSLTIAALTVALLTLLAACGREAAPTANPGPASSKAQDLVPPSPRQIEATPQPAFPRLEPPPGARANHIGSGGGRGEYNASVLLTTDMTLAALLEHYREQVLQPDWEVQKETMDEDLAALTWTLRDEADQPWFGVLLITPAEEGMWVRMWMGGGAGIQTFIFPDGREAPIQAPIRPN